MSALEARGRLPGEPVAIVDIGSNSVRLVAYECLTRALTPTFNEKVLCGLGRGVATTGFLPEDAVAKALAALQRFRVLCRTMDISRHPRAGDRGGARRRQRPAVPRAGGAGDRLRNRPAHRPARGATGRRSASCPRSTQPDGVVGDLGGGSLELTDVKDGKVGRGVTLPLGGLSLMELSDRSPKKAAKIARDALAKVKALDNLAGRTFYAVGGTWRSLARLHMRQRQYPMHVMHNYVIPTRDALEFAKLVERIEAEALTSIESVSAARRPLLAYGAAVLEEIIRRRQPKEIVISALGVREGLLFEGLSPAEQAQDPLIVAARQFNLLRSRAPGHAEELFHWTSQFLGTTHLEETAGGDAAAPRRLPAFRHRLARPSRLSRRTVLRPRRQRRLHRPRPSLARLSRARGVLPPRLERPGRQPAVALAGVGAPARSRANPRRGDARRLHRFGRHARRVAAHADGGREGPHRADAAERSRRAQQRPAADPAAAVRPADRRRSGGPGGGVEEARGERGEVRARKSLKFELSDRACHAKGFIYEFGPLIGADHRTAPKASGFELRSVAAGVSAARLVRGRHRRPSAIGAARNGFAMKLELSPSRASSFPCTSGASAASIALSAIWSRSTGRRASSPAELTPNDGGEHWSVGHLISIVHRKSRLVGVVCELSTADRLWNESDANVAYVKIELSGEIVDDEAGEPLFFRGIRSYPALGAIAHRIRADDLKAIYTFRGVEGVEIGRLTQNAIDSRLGQRRRAGQPPFRGDRLDRRRQDHRGVDAAEEVPGRSGRNCAR